MEGKFGFNPDNGYAFVSVSRELTKNPYNILKHKGFKVRYTIRKQKFPGISLVLFCSFLNFHFLGAHTSLMIPREYGSVDASLLNHVQNKWKDRKVRFNVIDCNTYLHEDKFGQKAWIICLKVSSRQIAELRSDLGLYDLHYNSHVSILEYEIN